jgi:hypothetical protein
MDNTIYSRTTVLNYGLATFLVAFSAMILLYEWIM